MEIKPGELSERFNDLVSKLPEAVDLAIDAGLHELDAEFANRVWNQNEDVNGKKFGKYRSKAYADYREKNGRQILEKDLQLIGSLRNSVEIDFLKKALVFNQEKFALIADGQEKQMSTVIFEASKIETEKVIEAIDAEFTIFTKSIIESK